MYFMIYMLLYVTKQSNTLLPAGVQYIYFIV